MLLGQQQANANLSGQGSWIFLRALLGPSWELGVSSIQPDSEGWYEYTYSWPPDRVLLQFKRVWTKEPPDIWIGYANFDPEFNIANLCWRYTGIGRHQMEAA